MTLLTWSSGLCKFTPPSLANPEVLLGHENVKA